jgi:tetratricopeptide (TPR) repeat protein
MREFEDEALVGMPDELSDDEPAAEVSVRPHRKRTSILDDPVVRRLTFVALGLVLLYLLTITSALVLGVLGASAPKTVVERDVQYYEALTMQDPTDTAVWLEYITALIEDGQYMKAQDVIDRATAAIDQSGTEDFSIAQAQLYFARGDYEQCTALADEIRSTLKAWYEESKATPGTAEAKGEPINDNYYLALVVKAEAQIALGDDEGAIDTLTLYLDDNPTAADVYVRRGDLRASAGDIAGAEADFREALRYIPDDAAALEGLRRIGADE